MKKKLLMLMLALFIATPMLVAQQLELEKTYKISRASKRGELSGLDYDKEAKTYTLTYFTGQKKNTFKYEQYVFDTDFNFIKDGEFEEDAEKMKKKFKWFRFKGETYVTEGNTMENNMMGTLVLKKKRITSTYKWLLGGYTSKTDILEKVKPKTDDGNTYTAITSAEDDINGDLYILATVKPKMSAKGNEDVGAMRLLKFNKDLDLVKTLDFDFPYTQSLAFGRALEVPDFDNPENTGVEGIVFVFAPSNAMGKKKADPNNNNYTYIAVNADCKITERFSFDSPASYWRIDEVLTFDNGDKYFYGPAAAGKDKYFNEGVKPGFGNQNGEVKYKSVQLLKASGGKLAYITETSLEEFKAKQQFPPNQKKTPDYNGREFAVRSYEFGTNGDLYVLGQNYDKNKEGQIKRFEDVLGFHFDTNGKLRAQYGLDTKEAGVTIETSTQYHITYKVVSQLTTTYACPQQLIEGTDGNMYWILQEIKGMREGKLLTYPRIGRITPGSATMTDLVTFGKGAGYYLNPNYPTLETDKGETLIFFGADKPGKELWFARVKLK